MNAAELFAISQGTTCEGHERCYWCGAGCSTQWIHNEMPPAAYTKYPSWVKIPSSNYLCVGCWLFRRRRVTVEMLDGGFKDGQCAVHHSWLITRSEAKVITPYSRDRLFEVLRKPPRVFALLLRESADNHIQLGMVNSNESIQGDTPLHFTIDNTRYTYTVYELEHALHTKETEGKSPGVGALIRLLGWPESASLSLTEIEEEKKEEKRGPGRPSNETRLAKELPTSPKKVIRR